MRADRRDAGDRHDGERGGDRNEAGPSQAQFLTPAGHEQVIADVSSGEAFGKEKGRDRPVAAEQPSGMSRHDPRPATVCRSILVVPGRRHDATVDLQGHALVVDLESP